jgi:hypothetical protein
MMLLLNTAIFTIPSCSAADVYWSDDFGDGSYYPEWNVTIGGFAAGVGILRSTSSAGFPHQAIIYHASTASYGSWTFDLLFSTSGTKVMVAFMHNVKATSVFGAGIEGYTVELNGTHITLFKSTDIALTPLDTANYAPAEGMLDMQITRVANGTFYVRAESYLYLTALDTTYTTSTYFTLGSAPHGYGIDNIVVSGTDGITPPPVIPGFPTIAIIAGVLTALSITLLRRRRTPT